MAIDAGLSKEGLKDMVSFMPSRVVVSERLGRLFSTLAHPHRIQIIEELRTREKNVKELEEILEISHSRVSQHLSVLRAQSIVEERREGRKVYYHLTDPALANWILGGVDFIEEELHEGQTRKVLTAVKRVRDLWGSDE